MKTSTFVICIASLGLLIGCSANNASVRTSVSPIDGKSTTIITDSAFSLSYIYPANDEGLGIRLEGGRVFDKEEASIIFDASTDHGFREAFFKADGETYFMTPSAALTDFKADKHGVRASKEFMIGCSELVKVANSKDVYLRITYSNGFVDYNVSKPFRGSDGFGMVKKIASYCV
ncbi:hypothetical protein [Paraglaciecola sp. 2405UD69-4]|uniref:hypothetical protein n=1 Tax=Paraglaciecola sp. 2405UD69-4 TaxID=3391836 RepID=UPI0039C8F0B6